MDGITFTKDGSDHQTNIEYADLFSDGNNSRNTLAYPTKVKDPDWNASTSPNNYANAQYNFDLGVAFRVQGPPPKDPATGQPYSQWEAQKTYYDAAGRVETVKNEFNGGYSRYVYGPYYVQNYTSVNTAGDDSYAIQTFDGAGRVIGQASNHPGSTGGYKAQLSVYDRLGQMAKQSNAAEITAGWVPTGDDAAGWLYAQQTYDWKGRSIVTTNADTTTRTVSYNGCGCVGGELMTLTDEGAIDNGVAKRRQKKLYNDVLGRTWKSEVLNWEGGTSYSSSVTNYNARDQVTQVRQFSGTGPTDPSDLSCPSGTCQQTSLTYDGHGRPKTKHVPEQDSNSVTTFDYFLDDSLQRITDARGAAATYTYNGRHLITGLSYSAPSGSGITVPATVAFGYDAAGNRDSMSDGLGNKSYTYDQLSRMLSETRVFTGVGTFTLSYDYNYASQLKKITDATGMAINYSYDAVGQLSGVTGSGNLYAGVSTYASGLKYRAWGGLKQFTDGSSHTSNIGYNARLQVNHFDISGGVVNQNYDYYNDGRIKFVHNTTDNNFERSYSYDHAGRLASAASGGVARGDATVTQTPYNELFGYDAFSNPNYRYTGAWSNVVLYDHPTYTNNRHQDWAYDADGRNTNLEGRQYSYDAAGQMTGMSGNMFTSGGSFITSTMSDGYDGAGAKAKEVSYDGTNTTTYYLTSSALGGAIVEEMDGTGQKRVGYVYAGGQILAQQSSNVVTWKHNSPTGASQYNTVSSNSWSHTEFDPVGADITYPQPPPPDDFGEGDFEQGHFGGIMSSRFSELLSPSAGCTIDGMKGDCGLGMSMINSGAASFGPARTVAGIYNRSGEYVGLAVYSGQAAATGLAIFGQGSLGFLPAGTSFTQAPGGAALSFASWFTSLPEYANQFNDANAGFGSMQGLNPGLMSVKSAQMMSIFFGAAAIPQDPVPLIDPTKFLKLAHAFGDARTALTANGKGAVKKCVEFFTQGRSLNEVLSILANFKATATYDPGIGKSMAVTANSGGGMNASVTMGNAFFANDDSVPGTGLSWSFANEMYLVDATQLSPRQNRALTVLHELAHALGLIPSDNLKNDPNGKISEQNNALIYEKCKPLLNSLPLRDNDK